MKNSPRWLVVSALFLLARLGAGAAEPVDAYARWVKAHFGVEGAAFSQAFAQVGPSADPDADGLPNLAEYALGLDPRNPSSYPAAEFVPIPAWGAAPVLSLTTTVRADDQGLIYVAQVSEDGDYWWPSISLASPVPGDANFYTAQAAEGPVFGGLRAVQYAARPDSPLRQPQFIRLAIVRYAASAVAPGVAPAPAAMEPQAVVQAAIARARTASKVETPPIPGLFFTSQLSALAATELTSNSIRLRGFPGKILVTAPDGVTLVIDGREFTGSAYVKAGDLLSLKATVPSTGARDYTVAFGKAATAVWRVQSQAAPPLASPAGTVSGHTPVNASVGLSGEAQISMPITGPPGIGGLEPKLTVNYSSQAGHGLLGIGFQLGGLSAITRTAASLAIDGVRGSISFDFTDRFSLDGARLICISGEDGKAGALYSKENDDGSRIRSLGQFGKGPQSWIVETKAGLTFEYGLQADSRITNAGNTEAMVWALTRVTDSTGNQMYFTYVKETGTYRIDKIDYTCRGSIANNLSKNTVRFLYESRPDVRTSHFDGQAMTVSKRLKTIETRHAGALVRSYAFAYEVSEGASRLARVTETGSDGRAFAPTTITWQDNATIGTFAPAKSSGIKTWAPTYIDDQAGDFNGDGLTDLLIFNTTRQEFDLFLNKGNAAFGAAIETRITGWNGAYSDAFTRVFLGDFNGDGKLDVMSHDRGTDTFHLYLANGAGFNAAYDTGIVVYRDGSRPIVPGDFNGDGRTDFLIWRRIGSVDPDVRYYMYLSAGTSFARVNTLLPSWDNSRVVQQIPGDFNGDGKTDLLMWHVPFLNNRYNLYLSNGKGFSAPTATTIDTWDNPYVPNIGGDFNGDGLTDLLVWHMPFQNSRYNLYTCTGTGFLPAVATPVHGDDQKNVLRQSSNDFTGDGLMDMLVWAGTSDRYLLYRAQGGNFTAASNTQVPSWDNPKAMNLVGDFNGDGRSDVCVWYAPYNNGFYNIYLSQGEQPNLVTKVTNGHGSTTSFEYEPLTNSAVYTKSNSAAYPAMDLQAPIHVVSAMTFSNGLTDAGAGAVNRVRYQYRGLVMRLDGRGLQPPKSVVETNEAAGLVTETAYETDPRLAGSPRTVTQRLVTGRLISSTVNSWTLKPRSVATNRNTWFAYNAASETSEHERNTGALVKKTTVKALDYDDRGNLKTSQTVIEGSGQTFTEHTANVYQDTTAEKWFLGRLSQAIVRKGAPAAAESTRGSEFAYDSATGLLVGEIIEPNDPKLRLEKRYLHDQFGNITASTETAWNGRGTPAPNESRTKTTEYSADGRFIVRTVNALGHAETTEHDPLLGLITKQAGPNGLVTRWEYDGFGRPTRELRADGTETRTWYLRATPGQGGAPARAVHCVVTQSTGGAPSTVWFDLLDREIQRDSLSFDGRVVSVRKTYNARGEIIRVTLPFFAGETPLETVLTYDDVGRNVSEVAPGNRVTATAYNGLTTTVTNPQGQRLTRLGTVSGKFDTVTDHYGQAVDFLQDSFGNLIKITDAAGHETHITYNNRGQKISLREPNTGLTTYAYNGFGELISQTTADKLVTVLSYDLLGRLIKRQEGSSIAAWTYDYLPSAASTPEAGLALGAKNRSLGKLVRSESPGFREDHRYDSFGRPVEIITRLGTTSYPVNTAYDFAGRVESVTYPTAFAIRHQYTARGHLLAVVHAASGQEYWRAGTVNARGQVEKETLGGVTATARTFEPETGRMRSVRTGPWDPLESTCRHASLSIL